MKPKGHKVDGKNVSGDSAMEKVIAAQAKMAELREENKALRKDRDQLVSEYNDMVNARKVKLSPSKVQPKGDTMIRVCAGDVHGMRCDKAAVNTFLSDVKLLDPDEVVLGGDIVDCGGWLAKHHTIGYVAEMDYSYQEDIAVANEFLDRLQEVAPRAVIHYLSGNHECTHPDHEVLTKEGWKPIEKVSVSDLVASTNEYCSEIIYDHPTKIHTYNFDGDMVRMDSLFIKGMVTPNHRTAVFNQVEGVLQYFEAGRLIHSNIAGFTIPYGENLKHVSSINGDDFSYIPYKGPVYCLTMPQGNFVTRYKGTVYVTGNSRVERWITDQVVGNKRDGEFLREHFSPEKLLRLEERGIKFYERDKIHKDGLPRGWIKLGKMHFTHSLSYSKNAARDAATKTAGNVTYWCSHRADTATVVLPNVGMVHAYNPGCMCTIQPIYRTSFPTEWSQGYGIDVISDDGNFQRIQVPIWRGKSLATAMIHRLSGR